MSQKKRHLVTAALIYANGPIHIGHLAGCYIPSDLYVRFLRSKGEDVKFISGTDEHGVPITIKARDEKKSPQEVVDYYYNLIDNSFKEFGISFDIFSRTSKDKPSPSARSANPPKSAKERSLTMAGAFITLNFSIFSDFLLQ